MSAAPVPADQGRAVPPLRTRHVRQHGGTAGVVQLVSLELAVCRDDRGHAHRRRGHHRRGGVAAAGLLALVLGRVDGRWLYEEFAARWRIRRRRAEQARAVAGDRRGSPARPRPGRRLSVLAPGYSVIPVADRNRSDRRGQRRRRLVRRPGHRYLVRRGRA